MHDAPDTLVIPSWANGPGAPGAGSGNGGWTAGLLAPFVTVAAGAGVAVSLRVPPPIGRELHLVRASGSAELRDGDALVADAAPATVSIDVPDAITSITHAQALEAMAGFPFREHHPFPRCIACGIARDPGTPALGVHCGPVAGTTVPDDEGTPVPVFASAWTPTPDLANADRPEVASVEACWSALDCPSAAPFADPDAEHASVLARIAVRLDAPARIGEPHVLAAWRTRVDGRKQWSRSVLIDATGAVLGAADALWIEVRPR